jgi:hypothetical protein
VALKKRLRKKEMKGPWGLRAGLGESQAAAAHVQ